MGRRHQGRRRPAGLVLGPPAFFWLDWVVLFDHQTVDADTRRDIAKYTYDLGRNIWLGLVAILTVPFNIKITT